MTLECTCVANEPYVDGSCPSFYVDAKKAIYMFQKLRDKARLGQNRVHQELVIDEHTGEYKQGRPPLPSLREYGMFFGVHLNGEHVIAIIE